MSRSVSSIPRFPWFFFAGVGGLIILLVVGLAVAIYNSYQAQQLYQSLEGNLRELRTEVTSLNTELGLSVQLAVATQNLMWKTHHSLLKSKLNTAVEKAIKLAPESKSELQEVDDASNKIAEIEGFIFSLVSQSETQESHVLLTSEDYQKEQARYTKSLEQFALSLNRQAERIQVDTKKRVFWFIFIAVSCVTALLLIVMILLARWKKTIATAYHELANKEVELSEANRNLEADILEREKLEKQLEELAIHDALTGLYNRRYFNQRCAEEIAKTNRSGRPFAILLCDLDRFKEVNDIFGHPLGDDVLKSVSRNIKDALREVDLVFRWGGDEFIIIFPDTGGAVLSSVAERIRKRVKSYNEASEISIDISMGVAFYPNSAKTLDELVGIADRALYFSKKTQTHFHIGDEEYKTDSSAIHVVFQPIWDTRTNHVLGYEALSRDSRGNLPILELFKQYAAIGQLLQLKSFCFKEQLRKACELKIKKLFLNVDFDLLDYLGKVEKPLDIEVFLEISELETLKNKQKDMELVKEWRAGGYQFVIDDFGAGFVSFPFLADLMPSYVKIDRSVVTQAIHSSKFTTFLKHLVDGLRNYASNGLVVEGIETTEELELIQSVGLFLVQGYLLGRPKAELVGDKTPPPAS